MLDRVCGGSPWCAAAFSCCSHVPIVLPSSPCRHKSEPSVTSMKMSVPSDSMAVCKRMSRYVGPRTTSPGNTLSGFQCQTLPSTVQSIPSMWLVPLWLIMLLTCCSCSVAHRLLLNCERICIWGLCTWWQLSANSHTLLRSLARMHSSMEAHKPALHSILSPSCIVRTSFGFPFFQRPFASASSSTPTSVILPLPATVSDWLWDYLLPTSHLVDTWQDLVRMFSNLAPLHFWPQLGTIRERKNAEKKTQKSFS